ncbi:MAG: type II toxin-antitoxin system RelE/ParE family toxin [Polyangiaceae bacterium]|nr:type II toxin-antitoxin system RelE/ParE family toxin [Polyangiaceae bacterium]
MSATTYHGSVKPRSRPAPTEIQADKPLAWLHGEVKSPPLSAAARVEMGTLLRRLQRREKLAMPASRPMPSIGPRCHELRVNDENATWRLIYRIDPDAIVIVDVFSKKTAATPQSVTDGSKQRLKQYDAAAKEDAGGQGEED